MKRLRRLHLSINMMVSFPLESHAILWLASPFVALPFRHIINSLVKSRELFGFNRNQHEKANKPPQYPTPRGKKTWIFVHLH